LKVFITGATGFVGTALTQGLLAAGHDVHWLVRSGEGVDETSVPGGVAVSVGDPTTPGPHWEALAGCDCAVNLAGHPIFGRWSARTKELIRTSRLATTRNLVAALPGGREFTLVSASGIGIYGDCGEEVVEENNGPGAGFLSRLAVEWELAACGAEDKGARVALARFGVIFGHSGGALPELAHRIKQFAVGPVGTGRQWMAWIHIADVVCGIIHILENPRCNGPYNFCSPQPARQAEVARAIGKAMGRHAVVPAPMLMLRMALGEFAEVAVESQKAHPGRLIADGYRFRWPDLDVTLADLVPKLP